MTPSNELRRKAMDLLARREHSVKELREKLLRRYPERGELLERVLQQLANERLQSDQRFAESFVRMRLARGVGPLRLVAELRQRGVAESLTREAIEGAEVDWWRQARQVLHKKFGAQPAAELRERARRARFLQGKGYTMEQINFALE